MPTPLTFFWNVLPKICFVLFSFPTFRNSISSPSGNTALILSAEYGRLEVCKLLVSSKADLAARDRCGRCQRCSRFSLNQSHPLACSNGYTALKGAMNRNKSDVVAFLRSIGAPQWLHAAVTCNSCDNKIHVISQTRWLKQDLIAALQALQFLSWCACAVANCNKNNELGQTNFSHASAWFVCPFPSGKSGVQSKIMSQGVTEPISRWNKNDDNRKLLKYAY